MIYCPKCGSERIVKNGLTHHGKQNYRCKNCGRQFVLNPTKKVISQETKERIDKLLLEKLPLAGIARVEGVSESWLQSYVNQKYDRRESPWDEGVPRHVDIEEKKGD